MSLPAPAKWLLRGLLGIPLVLLGYLGAVLLLGCIPVHRHYQPAPAGIPVWLNSNGIHGGLVLPLMAAGVDWRTQFPPQTLAAGKLLPGWDSVEIGWGSRTFYLNTPQWSDLRPGTALYALSGLDSGALHVEYRPHPRPGPDTLAITLSPADYQRLAAYIRASAMHDALGRTRWIAGHHYDIDDAFYQANGHFSPFMTCNQWVRNGLATAGVRVPLWAPFGWALFWQLR
jgi:uncharacterized protein (TIGR02117 family)